MFSKLSVRKKLWIYSSVLICNLLIIGGVAVWKGKEILGLATNFDQVQVPAVRAITLVDMFHDGLRGVVLNSIVISGSKDKKEIDAAREEYAAMSKDIVENFEKVDSLNINPEVEAQILEVKKPLEEYVKSAGEVVDVALSGKAEQALAMMPAFSEKFTALESTLEILGERVMKVSEEQHKKTEEIAAKANFTYGFLICAGLLVGLFSAWALMRSLSSSLSNIFMRIRQESESLAGSAQEVASTATNLAASVSSQASAVQETAASLEEIQSMVKKTEEGSSELAQSAESTHRATSEGQNSLESMKTAIDAIKASNQNTFDEFSSANAKILEIVNVIKEIGEKTRVINDIVFQTKLLSFNASVEAARAGEHGKGFAVVAEEVGNLAQMSGNAAKDITEMLEAGIQRANAIVETTRSNAERLMTDGREKITQGIDAAEKCGTSFGTIVNQISQVSSMTGDINSAIREQTTGLGEITKAINLFNSGTQQSSRMSEQASQVSESLLTQSRALNEVIWDMEKMFDLTATKVEHQATVVPLPVPQDSVQDKAA